MSQTPEPGLTTDDEPACFLAAHPAPAACADALIRDDQSRILLVDPAGKPGWTLPGGMSQDEGPADTVRRVLRKQFGLDAEMGRLLAVDTIPASRLGRTVVAHLYAAHPRETLPDAAGLTARDVEIRAAGFFSEEQALDLLPDPMRRRLAAALDAEAGAHTALLSDGRAEQPRTRDYYAQLPAPMMAATVVVTDQTGRILILKPSYKGHFELPGGMVLATESPGDGAARELREELGLTVPVGRVLAVDTSSAAAGRHGRALTCFVYATEPLTPDQVAGLEFLDGEVEEAHWMDRAEAAAALPPRLMARVEAGLHALATGTVVHLERGATTAEPAADTVRRQARAARAAMVERLQADGVLTDPVVRSALLAVRREVLVPRCYIPRPVKRNSPRGWQLLDGADVRDRAEWLELIHGDDSVMVQHAGEDPDEPARAQVVVGGGFTTMTTAVTTVVHDLQALRPRAGDRALELGTGPGLVTATLCAILGADAVTSVEVDQHLVQAARSRLAQLGYRPTLVCGDGLHGHPDTAPYQRVLLTFAVRHLPERLLAQLAEDGTLVAPITSGSALGPARAVIHHHGGRLVGTLDPIPSGHRPGLGLQHLPLPEQWPAGRTSVRTTDLAPPERSQRGLWVALAHLAPGLVRAADTDRLVLHSPAHASAVAVTADGTGWRVEQTGPRDIWGEVREIHNRWTAAGRPQQYRIEVTADGQQHVSADTGAAALTWTLPTADRGIPVEPDPDTAATTPRQSRRREGDRR